jgi:predicted ATPase
MARHDFISRSEVARCHGRFVKSTGDGMHAAFGDALDALTATLAIQLGVAKLADAELPLLLLRCGLHVGVDEQRDGDFYGPAVNRAARVTAAAHGGQVLLSQAVVDRLAGRMPDGASLRALGRVRLRDLSRPENLYQLLHPQLRNAFPPLRSLDATPNNLKQQLNSFVGREQALDEVRRLLAANRLLTLLGMGGIGKSRLSVQLAAEVLVDFPDGVWMIELEALTDPAAVPLALARVLGVKEETERPITETLQTYARDRRLLVVLDNCEHLLNASAALARSLLEAGPQVKVLATSRDFLRVPGEAVFHVPTLSVPELRPDQAPASPESLLRHEAVRLFVDRASMVQPNFRIDERSAAAVAEIARRLDGIALAIELAAARVRAMPVQTIAERLHDRFRVLVSGDATAPARGRTLRALIDWSYDLLAPMERIVFQRLAVFSGGCALDAAECVLSDASIAHHDVLDWLSRLVEKSLVILEPESDRYRMLDTVRVYAQERLTASVDDAVTRNRHLHYFVAFAEQQLQQIFGPGQGDALAALDKENENLLAAHAWCGSADNGGELDLRLVSALKFYWLNRGVLAIGHRVACEALARPDAQQRDARRSRGLFDRGQISCFMGRYAEALAPLQESLAIAREIGDTALIAAALQPLGMAAIGVGDTMLAHEYLVEAVALARRQGKGRQLAAALNALAQLLRMQGQLDGARPLYTEVLTLSRAQGDNESVAIGLLNLAMVEIGTGAAKKAQPLLSEAISIARTTGSKAVGQSALEVTAGLSAAIHDWKCAARLFGAAEQQATRTAIKRDAVDEAFLRPLITMARGAMPPDKFAQVEASGRAITYEAALREAESWMTSRVTGS